ncbi:M28 family metallopeptidase [Clostridium sp. SM-530-WT-3G]|uniref:M28 family metallopeptidase n=1 Tax=Clostridium sp. SM-530-WT-3G TaxID=2725303 RepID=UPI001FABC55A|nr:M28 family metallopeptidase [Clostridium sp. SM-530-WT-3G]
MKKNLNRFFYCLFLLIFLTILTSSLVLQVTYHKFSTDNVLNNIKYLSSDKFEGRLTGSYGCEKTSDFIENYYRNYNINSLNNNYKESFNMITPILNNTKPKLILKNQNKIVKEYKYGVDYKEDLTNFRTSNAEFSNSDDICASINSILITQNNHKYLFNLNCHDNNFSFRSSFNSSSKYDFCIDISPSLYNDILNGLRNGYTLFINLPYTLTEKSSNNIIGYIKGTSPSLPPLILSAHFDHMGKDYLNNCYYGALDNASGTSFMLEMLRTLSSIIKPKRTIIFVSFSGEEFGLIGSKNFVYNHFSQIKNADVINFDMIGAPKTDLTLMVGKNPNKNSKDNSLVNSLEKICIDKSIKYSITEKDSSDHASFCNAGINAVTICHADTSRIHTPYDTIEHIDSESINTVYTLVMNNILSSCYDKYFLLIYNPLIPILSCICFIIMILYHYYKYDKNNKEVS